MSSEAAGWAQAAGREPQGPKLRLNQRQGVARLEAERKREHAMKLAGIMLSVCLLGACSSPPPGTGPTPSPSSSPSQPNPSPTPIAPAGEVKIYAEAQCETGSYWVLPKDEVIAVSPCLPPGSRPPYLQPAATHQMSTAQRTAAQQEYAALQVGEAPDLLGSLTPDRPLAAARRVQCQSGEGVIFNGGLLGSCTQYLLAEDESFRLIQNPEALQSFYAPVESPEEAASYAIARSGSRWMANFELKPEYRYYTRLIRRSRVETQADGSYKVLLYAYQQFGCGPHDHSAVTYQVGRDGSFSEVSRAKVWADPIQDGLCVD